MKSIVILVIIGAVFAGSSHGFYRIPRLSKCDNIVHSPLILTPYIKGRQIKKAQKLARVKNLSDVISYSGYLTVNSKYNSNLYFWFFPAAINPTKAPVLIWLNGGPGSSSMFGLFVENGPFKVDSSNNLQFRTSAWTLTHSVIYFDNPVGVGFSYTDHDAGYARTEEDVANDLYRAVTQFFNLFPEYQDRELYITGQSYAGKYIPAISYKIHTENNLSPKIKINFKGMAIGNGFSDPENMLNFGEYLYNIGLLDYNQKLHFENEEEKTRRFIRNEEWTDAYNTIENLIYGDNLTYYENCTGFDAYYNLLMAAAPKDQNYYVGFLQLPYVRQALHVGNKKFVAFNPLVQHYLKEDVYKSVLKWIVALLDAEEKYQVLIYNGQLDPSVSNVATDNFLRKMQWHGSDDYAKAERKIWRVGNDVAGYVKVTDNLTYLLIRNAGHVVPYDQPKWSFDMINRFTSRKSFAKIECQNLKVALKTSP